MEMFEDDQKLIEILSRQNGIIFLLGQTDTGKTTFARNLAQALLEKNKTVAFLDSDVGQSTIGPPTTIGLKILTDPQDLSNNLSNNQSCHLYFVGSTSPRGHFLPMVIGTYKLSRMFFKKVETTIIDTTGLVHGIYGRTLKFYKISLVLPHHLVLLEKENELYPYKEIFKHSTKIKVYVLKTHGDIKEKSYEDRVKYRNQKFYQYFKDAKEQTLYLENLSFFPPFEEFRRRVQKFNVIGLEDPSQNLLGIGVFLDFENEKRIKILSPVRDIGQISLLKLGFARVENFLFP